MTTSVTIFGPWRRSPLLLGLAPHIDRAARAAAGWQDVAPDDPAGMAQLLDPIGGITQIKQVDLSGQWPASEHLTLLGRWNYSFTDKKTLEAVAGIEYNGDCWVLRVVGQRLTTTTQQTSTGIFLQLELNGLARVGTSPLELLRRSVPGYVPTNDPTLRMRDRSLDPVPGY